MKILFDNITVLFENGVADTEMYLSVTDKKISYVGKTKPDGIFDRVIDGHIKKLRRALGPHADCIKTVVKRGYKLEVDGDENQT